MRITSSDFSLRLCAFSVLSARIWKATSGSGTRIAGIDLGLELGEHRRAGGCRSASSRRRAAGDITTIGSTKRSIFLTTSCSRLTWVGREVALVGRRLDLARAAGGRRSASGRPPARGRSRAPGRRRARPARRAPPPPWPAPRPGRPATSPCGGLSSLALMRRKERPPRAGVRRAVSVVIVSVSPSTPRPTQPTDSMSLSGGPGIAAHFHHETARADTRTRRGPPALLRAGGRAVPVHRRQGRHEDHAVQGGRSQGAP